MAEMTEIMMQLDSANTRIQTVIIEYLDRAGIVSKADFASVLEGMTLGMANGIEKTSLETMVRGLRNGGAPQP